MQRILTPLATLTVAALVTGSAGAVVIETSSAALVPPISGSAKGRPLENQLNDLVFNPLGIVFEAGATTGGTPAQDDMTFEGPGLTVITGFGFILRFNNPVDQVRVRFGNFKDLGSRTMWAFDFAADYVRDPGVTSQNPDGDVTAFPDTGLAINSDTGIVPSGSGNFLDLIVSGPGNISSILVATNRFLWSLEQIEVAAGSVQAPEPGTLALFVFGLAGLGVARRR